MENKIYNDDVERIVNDPERQEAISRFYKKRKTNRQNKILIDAFVYLTFSVAFSWLCWMEWMVVWLSIPVSMVCLVYSSFLAGRWFEYRKIGGRK